MIIRILGEGQFRVAEDEVDELNRLDDALSASLDSAEGGAFDSALSVLLARVRSVGEALASDDLSPSDAVLPPADATPTDVRDLLTPEGVIPG